MYNITHIPAGHTQSPEQFAEVLSSTSGLAHVVVWRNMTLIQAGLANMRAIFNGRSVAD